MWNARFNDSDIQKINGVIIMDMITWISGMFIGFIFGISFGIAFTKSMVKKAIQETRK